MWALANPSPMQQRCLLKTCHARLGHTDRVLTGPVERLHALHTLPPHTHLQSPCVVVDRRHDLVILGCALLLLACEPGLEGGQLCGGNAWGGGQMVTWGGGGGW